VRREDPAIDREDTRSGISGKINDSLFLRKAGYLQVPIISFVMEKPCNMKTPNKERVHGKRAQSGIIMPRIPLRNDHPEPFFVRTVVESDMSVRDNARSGADNPDEMHKLLADYWEQMKTAPPHDHRLRIKKSEIVKFRGVVITVNGGKEGILGFVINITDTTLVLGNIIPCTDGRFEFIGPLSIPIADIDDDVIQLPPGYTPSAVSDSWITLLKER
jgi:hypothetical protein